MQKLARASLTGDADATPLKTLKYIDLLLSFCASLNTLRGGDRRLPGKDDLRAKLGGVPEFLVESIKKQFVDGKNIVTRFKYDLLLSTLCALTLHVDGFETDTWDLKEDLRLENSELAVYFKELGCKVSNVTLADQKKFGLQGMPVAVLKTRRKAVLTVPLSLPVVRSRMVKRK